MKPGSVASNRYLLWWPPIFGIVGCLVLGVGLLCYATARAIFPPEQAAPAAFPQTDLVFNPGGKQIGFVNADGTRLQTVRMIVKVNGDTNLIWPWRPVISGDNQTLIIKVADHINYVWGTHGLVLSQPGKLPVLCDSWDFQHMAHLSADQQEIFIQTGPDLQRYRLSSCGTVDPPLETYAGSAGIPSPDLKYVVYMRSLGPMPEDDHLLLVRPLAGGEERTVGVGDYPAWSRDSRRLAYTGRDGIYVVDVAAGTEAKLVVPYTSPYPGHETLPAYQGNLPWQVPPEVSWSPDGQWLVYQRWLAPREHDATADPGDHAIYKVNVATGEETLILEGGMYPYWRWPVEEP